MWPTRLWSDSPPERRSLGDGDLGAHRCRACPVDRAQLAAPPDEVGDRDVEHPAVGLDLGGERRQVAAEVDGLIEQGDLLADRDRVGGFGDPTAARVSGDRIDTG